MTRYFAMWSDPPFAEADKQWSESVVQSGRACARCGHLLPGQKIGPVILKRRPGDYPLNGIHGMSDGWMLRNDLLALLALSETPASGQVVPVSLADGGQAKGFYFLLAERIFARGQRESTIAGACPACGSVNYYPLPQPHKGGVRYLLKSSIEKPLPTYELTVGVLALREDVYNRVVAQNFPGLNFYELPIRDEPEDGLPANLKPYLTPEEQQAMGDILWRDANKDRRTDHGGQWLPWKVQRNVLNPRPDPGGKESA